MRVLLIGQGGREHALVRGLKSSESVEKVFVLPGNQGMIDDAEVVDHNWRDDSFLFNFINEKKINLVVLGSEAPLVAGLANQLRQRGITTFGPNFNEAQLEGSKIYAKKFMVEAGVPTAKYDEVNSVEEVQRVLKNYQPPYVLKADGLAAGKGVFICSTESEVLEAAHDIFVKRKLGEAGQKALLEEALSGWELSYLILTNGKDYQTLPLAQDYKRLLEGDRGPNTGGMGTIAPIKISVGLEGQIQEQVIKPILRLFEKNQMDYRGVLYIGLMITSEGPRVLEFNVRFGDPETQVIVPLLEGDWGKVLYEIAIGQIPQLKWKNQTAACVVMAAPGYPDETVLGGMIEGEINYKTEKSYFLHAGAAQKNSRWVVSGGRVMNSIGLGDSLQEALERAYSQSLKIYWKGLQKRMDIGRNLPNQ